MNSTLPMISIIVAVFNGAAVLQRCIDSVTNQYYPYKELIIIDGGSTDGTVDILKANNERITYWESAPDRGISHAWNKALRNAKGDWVIFLGADDVLFNDGTLTLVSNYLVENKNVDIVFGQILTVDADGKVRNTLGKTWNWTVFRRHMTIPHQGAFHSRKLFETIGLYNESYRIAADYELLLRKNRNLKAVFIDCIITKMQIGGLSQTAATSALRELMRSQCEQNAMHCFYAKLNYVWGMFKFIMKKYTKIFYEKLAIKKHLQRKLK